MSYDDLDALDLIYDDLSLQSFRPNYAKLELDFQSFAFTRSIRLKLKIQTWGHLNFDLMKMLKRSKVVDLRVEPRDQTLNIITQSNYVIAQSEPKIALVRALIWLESWRQSELE